RAVSEQTAEWLLKRARFELSGKPTASQTAQSSAPVQAGEPRTTTLFLTAFYHSYGAAAFSNSASTQLSVGTGKTLSQALDLALAGLRASETIQEPDRIAIDILSSGPIAIDVSQITPEEHASRLVDVGTEGLALKTHDRTFYLMPEYLIHKSISVGDPD